MVNAAAVIPDFECKFEKIYKNVFLPQDWIMREKSLATAGLIPRARVITGKATAPPPSLVIPV